MKRYMSIVALATIPSNFGGELIQVILKFDFELAAIVAETEAEDKDKKVNVGNKKDLIEYLEDRKANKKTG